jgi:UDP-glucose 4-epimerase
VISIFAKCLETNTAIKLNGGGIQTRDFISVHDVVKASVIAMNLDNSKCNAAPINLGTGKSIEIRALAELMMKVSGKKVPTTIMPHREGDIVHSYSSIERAKTQLAWEPKTSLEDGLREILCQ